MNNIYVDELPKSCQQCPYYSYEETEDEFWEFCSWCGYEFSEETCPLKALSDRLAEERKKVVQEIKFQARARGIFGQNGRFMGYHEFNEILDQIERSE